MVTQLYGHMEHGRMFKNNDVIQHVQYMIFKAN